VKLSIIIINWNTRDLTLHCLRTVFEFPFEYDFEVLLVDNGSTDNSVEKIKFEFPQVLLIQNQDNVGFARANNQAIRQCKGEFILLLNSDTELKRNALNILVNYLINDSKAGGGGPLLINPDGSLQMSCFPFPTLGREFWRMFHLDLLWPISVYKMNTWIRDYPRQVDSIQGACLIIRRQVFEDIGLLDEDYFFYTEEIDFCYRMKFAGWQNWWIPQAEVIHYGGQSSRLVAEESFIRLYKTKIIYFRKHYPQPSPQIFKLILMSAAIIRLLLSGWIIFMPRPGRDRYLTLAKHYLRLITELPGM
jgi:GT2 family glycosyltransferase